MSKRRVAIMQPYFAPFAGYYRLLAAADVFVIYDCVQFPRRGWVHRNRLPNAAGEADWLTLPLKRAPQETLIRDMTFADGAAAEFAARLSPFPRMKAGAPLADAMLHAGRMAGGLVDYLEQQILHVRALLDFPCDVVRSSTLGADDAWRGQDRILGLLDTLDASDYVNAPGGRALYDEDAFAARDRRLHFLPDYQGDHWSLLDRLARQTPAEIRADILAQTPAF